MMKIHQQLLPLFINYLAKLNRIEQAYKEKDETNQELLEFWRGLVRDSNGKWLKYYFEAIKYFQYGIQPQPIFSNKIDIALLTSGMRQHKAFIKGLLDGQIADYRSWLIYLHRNQVYGIYPVAITTRRRFSLIMHDRVVLDAVIPLARTYNDPYINKGTQTLLLPGINRKGLPKDVWQNKNEVFHYYAEPAFFPQYLAIMEKKLKEIIATPHVIEKDLFSRIALYYQYGINMHIFENVNQSLFTNQANALLQVFGYKPISQGILDFVAMRLQPENFVRYFVDEVNGAQKQIPLKEDKYIKLSKIV